MLSLPFDPSKLELMERRLEKEKRRREEIRTLESSLIEFYKAAWYEFDPAPYVHGRHLEAIAEHLEAVSRGEVRKLLINIAPRHSKSLLVSVAWPAWIWTQEPDPDFPLLGPQCKFLCLSYGDTLALDLATVSRRLILSPWYQERWGKRVQIMDDQEAKSKFDTTANGTRISGSFSGTVTGRGADIRIFDDPHKADEAQSEAPREAVIRKYTGALKSRITDPKTSAEVIVMQRLHEEDLSGHILDTDDDFIHLYLPAEFEEGRRCVTPIISKGSGRFKDEPWEDWREDGELLWPERFGNEELAQYKKDPYEWAAQWQQRPEPLGGGILKREYWNLWETDGEDGKPKKNPWPECDYIIASLDPALTSKDENDPSGFTIWGTFEHEGDRAAILLYAWRKWLVLHGPQEDREPGESNADYRARTMPNWGLVEHVADSIRRFKVDRLLIEDKANGHDVNVEMCRLYGDLCTYELVNPGRLDKVARAIRVQPIFSEGQIWIPDRKFAQMVQDECAIFPRGKHDDLVDSCTAALFWLRQHGFLTRRTEKEAEHRAAAQRYRNDAPLYPV